MFIVLLKHVVANPPPAGESRYTTTQDDDDNFKTDETPSKFATLYEMGIYYLSRNLTSNTRALFFSLSEKFFSDRHTVKTFSHPTSSGKLVTVEFLIYIVTPVWEMKRYRPLIGMSTDSMCTYRDKNGDAAWNTNGVWCYMGNRWHIYEEGTSSKLYLKFSCQEFGKYVYFFEHYLATGCKYATLRSPMSDASMKFAKERGFII